MLPSGIAQLMALCPGWIYLNLVQSKQWLWHTMGSHPAPTGRPQRRFMFTCNHFEGIVDGELINAEVQLKLTWDKWHWHVWDCRGWGSSGKRSGRRLSAARYRLLQWRIQSSITIIALTSKMSRTTLLTRDLYCLKATLLHQQQPQEPLFFSSCCLCQALLTKNKQVSLVAHIRAVPLPTREGGWGGEETLSSQVQRQLSKKLRQR